MCVRGRDDVEGERERAREKAMESSAVKKGDQLSMAMSWATCQCLLSLIMARTTWRLAQQETGLPLPLPPQHRVTGLSISIPPSSVTVDWLVWFSSSPFFSCVFMLQYSIIGACICREGGYLCLYVCLCLYVLHVEMCVFIYCLYIFLSLEV